MSTYATTATIEGAGITGTVHVNRNLLDSSTVRLDVAAEGDDVTIYLAADQAEALAVAILEAAGLVTPLAAVTPGLSPIGGNRYPGRSATDTALKAVEDAVTTAREAGVGASSILAKVANGLTGKVSGYRERLIARRLTRTLAPLMLLDDDAVKVLDDDDRQARG